MSKPSQKMIRAAQAAEEVAAIREQMNLLKEQLGEAEAELHIHYGKAGVTSMTTTRGEVVAIVESPTLEVDVEELKSSIPTRLWLQIRSDSLAMPKYHSAKKMGLISPELAARCESLRHRVMVRVTVPKAEPVAKSRPKQVRVKSQPTLKGAK